MKNKVSALIKIGGCASLLNIAVCANAQKLSNIQEGSIWAPDKIKVDGLPTEWNNKFEARNQATNVYYSVANDEKNLYLLVQAANPAVTNKIIRGGISFTVNINGKKKQDDSPVITFPIIERADLAKLSMERYNTNMPDQGTLTPEQSIKRADSAMAALNRRKLALVKEIKVTGLQGITDTRVSIYNDQGIKASAALDDKNILTYELAVPLALLGKLDNAVEMAYNIKLNGPQITPRQIPLAGGSSGEVVSVFKDAGQVNPANMTPQMAEMMTMTVPTDVWGMYKLAKK